MDGDNSDSKHIIGLMLLISAAFVGTTGFRLAIPFIAYLLREDLGAAMTHIALMGTGFMLARALSSIIFGAIIEKYGRVLLFIVIGMSLNALVINMYAHISSWVEAVILRTLQGFLGGMSWPLIQLVTALASPTNIRGRILSLYFALGSLGIFAGNAIYALIYYVPIDKGLLLSSLIFSSAIILVIIGIRILGFSYYPGLKLRSPKRGLYGKCKESHILSLSVFTGGFAVTYGSAIIFGGIAYIYLYEVFSTPKPIAALILGITGMIGIFSSLILGWVADKKSEVLAVNIPLMLMVLAPIIFLFKNTILLIMGIVFVSIALRAYMPLSRRIIATHTEQPALGIGEINAIMNLGTSIGQIVFGVSYDVIKPLTYSMFTVEVVLPPIVLLLASPLALASMIMLRKSMSNFQ